jgi:hypothetical protein
MPRTPSLRTLFISWVCFSVAFRTVFQTFLTTFLIDSGYETPIKNMDELYASGIKLVYNPEYSFILETVDDKELSKVFNNLANCTSYWVCLNWALRRKNVSILLNDFEAEFMKAVIYKDEGNSEALCRLEDGVVFSVSRTMIMLHGDPLLRRVNEIIDRVVEAGIYNHWLSVFCSALKVLFSNVSLVQPFDGYYSFNLFHMQRVFYLLLMGWCLCTLCFMVEILYHHVLNKIV